MKKNNDDSRYNLIKFIKRMKKKYDDRKPNKVWVFLRPITIFIISIVLVVTVFSSVIYSIFNMFFGAVDKNDTSPVLFTIGEGASLSSVATKLEDQGLINSSFGLKLLADFTSVSSKVKNGEYVLDRTMSVQEILDVITRSTSSTGVIKVTLVEGMTVEDFAETLKNAGVISSTESFLNQCKDPQNYSDYYFVAPVCQMDDLKYGLEGYLFPDTYEFFVNSTNDIAIKRMLSRMNVIYTTSYTERADELGLTMHEVITLASIIEKEGRGEDFNKISAVFHNRIKKNMRLESDVTVQYALGIKKLVLSSEQLKVDSPYNTYVVSGIPAGPICNPSKDAIKAVLYPDEEILNGGYLYFTLTDPYTGEVKYSKTYSEHIATKNQYKDAWEAYDKAQGN